MAAVPRGACYDGINVVQQEYGTSRAGQIEYSPHSSTLRLQYKEKLYSLQSNYSIVLNRNLSLPEQFTTMLHELGHFYCGHLNFGNLKWLPTRPGLSENSEEFEAETVCWLVCQRLGIESASAEYLDGYLDNNDLIPPVSVDSILRAAGALETILSGAIKPRKELIIKEEAQT
ncbi:MAG: ImmA/IrrE family metallo-endopeptidase [Oscillospiraceae bacterium]|nr:ImmA/IrrE family metallo-endopeptidase [Oscillospiraceae bacterium]